MTEKMTFNRLRHEKSLHLKEHESNPIDWWNYGPDALQKARDENKPIFLSIGYSSCHLSHVMARESFEDIDTANFINMHFIPIKVDREELPDIDSYYQSACHIFTHKSGHPISAFLLPDMRPFYVGTYFPKQSTPDTSSFMDILHEIVEVYNKDRNLATENATKVTEAIEKGFIPNENIEYEGRFPHPMAVMKAIKEFEDKEHGGYGAAPKFPNFSFYEWGIEQILEGMIEKDVGKHLILSIEKMLMGGIHDHLRGGFHRYAIDQKWQIPHFEKILYDQAGLLRMLAKASLVFPSPLIFDCLFNTLDYLEKEMLGEEGYFFSSQSAESEGEEGLYYTWNLEEFNEAFAEHPEGKKIDNEKLENIRKWLNIQKNGNYHFGLNIISLMPNEKNEIFTPEGWDLIRKTRQILADRRKMRIPPTTDTKGVASWNFMLTSALIDVIQYCQIDSIRQVAMRIFKRSMEKRYSTFVMDDNGKMKIHHSTTRENSLPYLEDYVFFAESELRIYEISGRSPHKQNFLKTIKFIHDEFIENDRIFTRAISANEFELYPNQEYNSFELSYRSAASTLIKLTKKASTLSGDKNMIEPIEKLIQKITHEALTSPLNAGEALSALTYPMEAYHVIKIPERWLERPEFIAFIPFFMPRFVFDYHQDDNDWWQICSQDQCDLKGESFDELKDTLTAKKPKSE